MVVPLIEISPMGPSGGWLVLRALLSLGVVLALAVVLLRFVLPRLTLANRRGKQIEVVEVVPIDPKSKLVLVRAFDQELLVGVGVGGMHPLGSRTLMSGEAADEESPRPEQPRLAGRVR